jgi:hypothetical protein
MSRGPGTTLSPVVPDEVVRAGGNALHAKISLDVQPEDCLLGYRRVITYTFADADVAAGSGSQSRG